ncbi:MAG: glycosyltransferase family 4 protein [Bacteroidota bacterium]
MRRKPRICIIGNKYWPSADGPSRVIEDIVSELKDDYDFTLYTYPDPHSQAWMSGVRVIEMGPYPLGVIGVFLFILKCALHARKSGPFDLIHVHKTDAAFCIPLFPSDVPVVATSHEVPYKRAKWSWAVKAYFHLMEKIYVRSHAHLTAIAAPLTDYYIQRYRRNVTFIPNGIDTATPFNLPAAKALLASHQMRGAYICFAARRIIPTKGAHHMLAALQKIAYKGQVIIIGDDTELPAYTMRLHALAEGLNVTFLGLVKEKATLMSLIQGAKLFVFPSETEGMSIMLLEVANVGTPLVISDIPENTAVLEREEALFFQNQNVDDLAKQISWAITHEPKMETKAKLAQDKVRTIYDRKAIAEQYHLLFQELILKPVLLLLLLYLNIV